MRYWKNELEVAAMALEVKILIKNLLLRSKELNQFKDSGSVSVGDIEEIQEATEEFRKFYEDPNGKIAKFLTSYSWYEDRESCQVSSGYSKEETKQLMVKMEKLKNKVKELNGKLDRLEEKFRKYDVPKRFQMT